LSLNPGAEGQVDDVAPPIGVHPNNFRELTSSSRVQFDRHDTFSSAASVGGHLSVKAAVIPPGFFVLVRFDLLPLPKCKDDKCKSYQENDSANPVCHWYAPVGDLFPSVGTGLFRPHWPSLKMAVADFALRN
jgi:hypothetical protein